MKIDGVCYCGSIAFEADIDPESVYICHCTDCQTMSGTAFRTIVPASAETFRVVAGEPKSYVKTAESDRKPAGDGVLRDVRHPALGLRRRRRSRSDQHPGRHGAPTRAPRPGASCLVPLRTAVAGGHRFAASQERDEKQV